MYHCAQIEASRLHCKNCIKKTVFRQPQPATVEEYDHAAVLRVGGFGDHGFEFGLCQHLGEDVGALGSRELMDLGGLRFHVFVVKFDGIDHQVLGDSESGFHKDEIPDWMRTPPRIGMG